MITLYDTALIGENVYNAQKNTPVKSPSGKIWQCVDIQTKEEAGFRGAWYRAATEKMIIVAFKGTDLENGVKQGAKDLFNDAQLALNSLPSQIGPAKFLLEQARKQSGAKTVLLVGHSLGGALAQVIGYDEDIPFVTFNAPPMATNKMPATLKKARTAASLMASRAIPVVGGLLVKKLSHFIQGGISFQTGLNVRIEWDAVSSSWWGGGHIGIVKVLDRTFKFDPLTAHKMGTVCSLLNPVIGSHKDVGQLEIDI